MFNNSRVCELLNFYTNYRKDIITPGTELYKLKQEYDEVFAIDKPLTEEEKTLDMQQTLNSISALKTNG
jgi:hypothetical protein